MGKINVRSFLATGNQQNQPVTDLAYGGLLGGISKLVRAIMCPTYDTW